jgi:hypothetical protein
LRPAQGMLKPQPQLIRWPWSARRTQSPHADSAASQQLVVSAPKVLDERMPGDDDPGARFLREPSYRSQARLQPAVIRLDRHCCICRSLTPASSTRGPERHRRCPGLIALSTSDNRPDGNRLHFALRRWHLRARCNSAAQTPASTAVPECPLSPGWRRHGPELGPGPRGAALLWGPSPAGPSSSALAL